MRTTALIVLLLVALLAPVSGAAQNRSRSLNSLKDAGVSPALHLASNEETSVISANGIAPQLSRDFVTAGIRATTKLLEWQQHLELSIRNGYPPSEYWILTDTNQAAEAIRMAAVAASTDSEKVATQQLAYQYDYLHQWSMGLLQAYQQLKLAEYYMSPAALERDTDFRMAAACTESLSVMFNNGRLSDAPACQ